MTSAARLAAIDAVDRVIRSGAYSNVLVAKTGGLTSAEHSHYQRLVYTALRSVPYQDRVIRDLTSGRTIEPIVSSILRLALVDSAVLGTPDHAVVDEYVEAAKAVGKGRAAGFVNGVLRTFTRDGAPQPEGMPDAYPSAVRSIVAESLGEQADRFLEASNEAAPIGVYTPGSSAVGDSGIPGTRYLGPAESLGPEDQVIDPASAAVALAAAPRPGDRVLDVAAAPGGKTAVIEGLLEGGVLVAADSHSRRVRSAKRRLPDVAWIVADGEAPPFANGAFDRVVLDAPCTGLGTLRRRPEIRLRVDEDAPGRFGDLQRSLVERSIQLLRPGGRLVYSVCTVTSQETSDVTAGLGFHAPEGLPGPLHGDGVLLAPHTTRTDGMYIAVLDV